MRSFVDTVTSLVKEKGITKNKMLTDLGLSRNSLIDWKKRGTIPSAEVVSAIAEYLEVPIGTLLGVERDDEEQAKSPNEKLAIQMAFNCVTLSQLSTEVGVTEDTILKWLMGDTEFSEYYDRLSEIFEIAPTYWVRPGMVSPGIELTTEEYLLVLMYREYHATGKINEDIYGPIRHFFPVVSSTNTANIDSELLELLQRLSYRQQIKLIGYVERLLAEPVAADPSEAPSTKMAK